MYVKAEMLAYWVVTARFMVPVHPTSPIQHTENPEACSFCNSSTGLYRQSATPCLIYSATMIILP